MKRLLIGTILIAAALPAFADENEGGLTGKVNLTYSTIDVWRGINFVDESVLQPSVMFEMDEWSGFFWGRMELTDTNSYATLADPTGKFTAFRAGVFYEIDYSDDMDITVGALAHQYPDVGLPQTQEIYYGFEFAGDGNFSIEVMQDVQAVKGYYVRMSGSHTFNGGLQGPGGKTQPISIGAHVGYGDNKHNLFYYGAKSSTLADLAIWGSTSFELSDQMTVTPYVAYTTMLDPDLLKGSPVRNNFYGGVSVGFKF